MGTDFSNSRIQSSKLLAIGRCFFFLIDLLVMLLDHTYRYASLSNCLHVPAKFLICIVLFINFIFGSFVDQTALQYEVFVTIMIKS